VDPRERSTRDDNDYDCARENVGHRQSRIGRRRISRGVVQIDGRFVRRDHRVCLLSFCLSRSRTRMYARDAQGPVSRGLSDVALILSRSRAPCDACAMHYSSNDEYERRLSEGGYRGGPKCSILRPRCGPRTRTTRGRVEIQARNIRCFNPAHPALSIGRRISEYSCFRATRAVLVSFI